jgi:hypothetical protein
MPDFYGTPGEYRFIDHPDSIWITDASGYNGVVADEGWE